MIERFALKYYSDLRETEGIEIAELAYDCDTKEKSFKINSSNADNLDVLTQTADYIDKDFLH